MYNCYRVFYAGRLMSIFGTWTHAEAYIKAMCYTFGHSKEDYKIEEAFIEGIGF